MPLITPDQAVQESVQASLAQYGSRLCDSVGRLLHKRANNRAQLVASGVCVQFRGTNYFLTAAHAAQDPKHSAVLVATEETAVSIGQVHHSYVKGSEDADDLLDAGIALVTDEIRGKLSGFMPMQIDSCISRANYPLGHIFAVVGYPASRNKKPNSKSPMPSANASILVTGMANPQGLVGRPEVNGSTHIVLTWSEESNMDLSGNKTVAGSLKAMSGGAVFDLGDHSDYDVMISPRKPAPVLAGIFTRHIAAETKLLATRISAIVDVLEKEQAWPISPDI